MEERPKGSAGWTAEEAQERGARRQEIPEQKTFASWLRLKKIPFYNPRSDKRSTIREGASDFTIFFNSIALFIEFKAPGCKQDEDQIEFEDDITSAGFMYFVVYNASEAIDLCRKWIGI